MPPSISLNSVKNAMTSRTLFLYSTPLAGRCRYSSFSTKFLRLYPPRWLLPSGFFASLASFSVGKINYLHSPLPVNKCWAAIEANSQISLARHPLFHPISLLSAVDLTFMETFMIEIVGIRFKSVGKIPLLLHQVKFCSIGDFRYRRNRQRRRTRWRRHPNRFIDENLSPLHFKPIIRLATKDDMRTSKKIPPRKKTLSKSANRKSLSETQYAPYRRWMHFR